MHAFSIALDWQGGRNGDGEITTRHLTVPISIPKEMRGPDIGTNPDEMLVGAAATCYLITLAAMLEASRIVSRIDMRSTAFIDEAKGILTYRRIVHAPCIYIAQEQDYEKVEKLAHRAEKSCMISRALKGNVEIALQITIVKEEKL